MIAVGSTTLRVKAYSMRGAALKALGQAGDLEFRHDGTWEDFEINVPADCTITCRTVDLEINHEREFVVEMHRYDYGGGQTSFAAVAIASPRLTVLLPATYHNDNIGPFNIVGFTIDEVDLADFLECRQALNDIHRINTIGMNYTLKWGFLDPDEVNSVLAPEVLRAYEGMTQDEIGAAEGNTMEVWMAGGACTLQPKAYVGCESNRLSTHLDVNLIEVIRAYKDGDSVINHWREY